VTIRFTIAGSPRTKKTSNRIVRIPGKNGSRGFTKILPSAAHEAWFMQAMSQAPAIRSALLCAGAQLPLAGEINARVTFYRDRESGDFLGYAQALADFLQAPKYDDKGKVTRKGAGIILDDEQIKSWDGSRLAKDAARPRIEVCLEVTRERAVQAELLTEVSA
jgi:hypothetical protein